MVPRAAPTLCATLLACALAAPAAPRAASLPRRPGEPPLPPDLIALAGKMEGLRVSSERFRLRTSVASTGARMPREEQAFLRLFDIDLSGEATLSPPAGSFALTILGHTLRIRVVHGTEYAYEPAVARTDGGRPWVDVGRRGLAGLLGGAGADLPSSPAASTFKSLAFTLTGARSATELGPGLIDGVSITGFRAAVSASALEEPVVPAKPPGILRSIFGRAAAPRPAPSASPSAQLEAFIAASGLPVRTRVSVSAEGISSGALLDVFAINFALRVQPPPRDRTVSLATLRRLTKRRSRPRRGAEREDQRAAILTSSARRRSSWRAEQPPI